jgi:hypothetical protein
MPFCLLSAEGGGLNNNKGKPFREGTCPPAAFDRSIL